MNELLKTALEAVGFGLGLLTPFILDELWRRWKNKRRLARLAKRNRRRAARHMEVA